MSKPKSSNKCKSSGKLSNNGKKVNQYIMSDQARADWLEQQCGMLPLKVSVKYAKGASEHAGDLGAVPVMALLLEMENEAIDQLMYVAELRRRILLNFNTIQSKLKVGHK